MLSDIEKNTSLHAINDTNVFSNWKPGFVPMIPDAFWKIDDKYFYVALSFAIFLLLISLLFVLNVIKNRYSNHSDTTKLWSKNDTGQLKSQSLPETRRSSSNDFFTDHQEESDGGIALYHATLRSQLFSHSNKRKYNSLSKVHGQDIKSIMDVTDDFNYNENAAQSKLMSSRCPHLICKNMLIQTTLIETNCHRDLEKILGAIQCSIEFDQQKGLVVEILRCHHIPSCSKFENWLELSNVFVQILILPDEVCHQTRNATTQKDSDLSKLATFLLDINTISNKRLRLSVYYLDQRQVRHSLGHALMDLKHAQLLHKKVYELPLHTLHQIQKKVVNKQIGELEILLKYCEDEILLFGIVNCRNLSTDEDDKIYRDVFVRVELYYASNIVAVQETGSISLDCNLKMEDLFHFKLPSTSINLTYLVVTVHKILKSSNVSVPFGKIEIGAFLFARGDSLKHWESMLKHIGKNVIRWHQLNSFDVK